MRRLISAIELIAEGGLTRIEAAGAGLPIMPRAYAMPGVNNEEEPPLGLTEAPRTALENYPDLSLEIPIT